MAYTLGAGGRLLRRVIGGGSAALSAGLIALVRAYQVTVSPLLIGSCRFTPTCSEYLIAAVRTHGCMRGSMMGLWRICRCHPFSAGGLDPVPPRKREESEPTL